MGDFDVEPGPNAAEQHLDERMQEILKQSAYEGNKVFSGLLAMTILYRLVVDRELDRTLLTVLIAHVAIDVGYQLYYQRQQLSDLADE